jgi:large subunit ribosomal protein L31e
MAEEEKIYVIPLRRIFLGFPRYKRANKALRGVREYLEKHLKSDNIRIGKGLNEEIWKHGIKDPPHHVKVVARKDKEGLITAELFGYVDRKAKRAEEKLKNKEAKLKPTKKEDKENKKDSKESTGKKEAVLESKETTQQKEEVNSKDTLKIEKDKKKTTKAKSTSKGKTSIKKE